MEGPLAPVFALLCAPGMGGLNMGGGLMVAPPPLPIPVPVGGAGPIMEEEVEDGGPLGICPPKGGLCPVVVGTGVCL